MSALVYEVTLRVDAAIGDAYRAWLDHHVREMLALPGFLGAEVEALLEPLAAGELGWCVRYRLASAEALSAYLAEHAPRMRAEGEQRFGGRFRAERRVLSGRASY